MKIFRIYSFNNYPIGHTEVLAIVAMLYITSPTWYKSLIFEIVYYLKVAYANLGLPIGKS